MTTEAEQAIPSGSSTLAQTLLEKFPLISDMDGGRLVPSVERLGHHFESFPGLAGVVTVYRDEYTSVRPRLDVYALWSVPVDYRNYNSRRQIDAAIDAHGDFAEEVDPLLDTGLNLFDTRRYSLTSIAKRLSNRLTLTGANGEIVTWSRSTSQGQAS